MIKKVLGILVVSILGILVLIVLAGAGATANLRKNHPMPGELIDVGGYALHLACAGHGSPTVLIIAGTGATGVAWSTVIADLAHTNKICYYDRAGIGWSNTEPRAKNFAVMVDELHALVDNARLNDNLLLVGHSVGGIIARQYAKKYPEKVAGIVLVDSAQEEQFLRFPPAIREQGRKALAAMSMLNILKSTNLFALAPSLIPNETHASDAVNNAQKALMITNPYFLNQVELELGLQLDPQASPVDSLGELPLIVLSRTLADPDIPEAARAQYEAVWQELQKEHALLSTNGKLILVANSGHNIQLDRPDVVVAAIQDLNR